MPYDLAKNNFEVLYETAPDAEVYSNIINDLAIFSKAYFKGKFPLIAGLSALREDTLIKNEEARMNRLLSDAHGKIDKLDRNKIDYEFIRTEEFARIVFNIFDKARVDYREEKLKYYANILISYSTFEFSNDFYKEGIIESLSKFSTEHILVLDTIYNKHFEVNDEEKPDFEEQDNLCKDVMTMDVWGICVNTLCSDGFIYKSFWGSYFVTNYGIKCIDLIKNY